MGSSHSLGNISPSTKASSRFTNLRLGPFYLQQNTWFRFFVDCCILNIIDGMLFKLLFFAPSMSPQALVFYLQVFEPRRAHYVYTVHMNSTANIMTHSERQSVDFAWIAHTRHKSSLLQRLTSTCTLNRKP